MNAIGPAAGAIITVDPQSGDKVDGEPFVLEPEVIGGVPERVIVELMMARENARAYAGAFADAVKAQATKYNIQPSALRRYVCGREANKLDELAAEINDIDSLMSP